MKNIIKRWLDKLAAANKETFGTERLDCCTVGKKDDKVIVNNKKGF